MEEQRHMGETQLAHPIKRRTLLQLGATTIATLGGLQLTLFSTQQVSAAPVIASTATWGAQAARGSITTFSYKPTTILVHHTDSSNTTDYSQSAAYSLARSIQQSHFANGWIDSGQNFTISRGGYIMEGRHQSLQALQSASKHVQGAHCPVLNDYAVGIEDEGNYNSTLPPDALWNALINLCTYICQQYGLNANAIFGHRDFYSTDCPGTRLYGQLRALRLQVLTRLGKTLPPRTWTVLKSGMGGENVVTIQYLLRSRGYSTGVDGSFGSGTASNVSSFQAARGFSADGVVGQQTWEALVSTVSNGSSGDTVRAVQNMLNSKGYSTGVDGQFGAGTTGQVQSFQSAMGLSADGIVGLNTWCALVGGVVA